MRGDPVIDFVAIDRGNKSSNNAGRFQPPPTISSTAMTAVLFCNDRPSLTTRKLAGSSASKPTAFNASAPSPDWTGTKCTRSLSRRAIHATEPLRRWHSPSSPLSAPARLQTPTRAPVHRYFEQANSQHVRTILPSRDPFCTTARIDTRGQADIFLTLRLSDQGCGNECSDFIARAGAAKLETRLDR